MKKIMINVESVYFFVKPRKYCDLYDLAGSTKSDWFDLMRSEIRSQDLHEPDETMCLDPEKSKRECMFISTSAAKKYITKEVKDNKAF